MTAVILRRLLIMIPTLLLVSLLTFFIIQLPPGDYLTTQIAALAMSGETENLEKVEKLRKQYGLDKPFVVQYGMWVGGMLKGDFGQSFQLGKPVAGLIWERLGLTTAISLCAIVVVWLIAIPIGILSATRQYGIVDYIATLLGLIGMAVPPFLLALLFMFFANRLFGTSLGSLFSDKYISAPWSWGRLVDLSKHIWVPIALLSVSGTGGMIRTVRANLLDQLEMPYVDAARAKGLSEWKVVLKYPVRLAINPLVSTIGWMLPQLVSGAVIIDVVLSLPTTGPLMLNALLSQDMYLAGSIVMMLSVLTMIGTLVSDVLLAWVDPRIRFEGGTSR